MWLQPSLAECKWQMNELHLVQWIQINCTGDVMRLDKLKIKILDLYRCHHRHLWRLYTCGSQTVHPASNGKFQKIEIFRFHFFISTIIYILNFTRERTLKFEWYSLNSLRPTLSLYTQVFSFLKINFKTNKKKNIITQKINNFIELKRNGTKQYKTWTCECKFVNKTELGSIY